MARVLLVLAAIGLAIYALLDIGRTPRGETRVMPKLLWFVTVLIPVLGPVAWLTLGRPSRAKDTPAGTKPPGLSFGGRKRGPVAPDDDPAFLRRLGDEAWARKMEEKRRAQHDGRSEGHPPPPTPPDADGTSKGDSTAGDSRTGPEDPGLSPA